MNNKYDKNFEVVFNSLNMKEKVDFSKVFFESLKSVETKLNNDITQTLDNIDVIKNSGENDLEAYSKAEILLQKKQFSLRNYTQSKIKNLYCFNDIDLNKTNVITPKMEKGLINFISEWENKELDIDNTLVNEKIKSVLLNYFNPVDNSSPRNTNKTKFNFSVK